MNVLIIGGTGVLSYDFLELCSKKYTTHVLNRNNNLRKLPQNVKLLIADVRDTNAVKNVIGNLTFDVIIDFLSFNRNQLENTVNIFYQKFKQFIFISSADVYDRSNRNVITEDSKKPNFNWNYSVNKYEAEKWLQADAKKRNYIITIIEPYITYGRTRIPCGLEPSPNKHATILFRIKNNKPLISWGNVSCQLMSTLDFARNLEKLLLQEKAFNQIFIIAGEFTYKWEDVLYELGRLSGKEAKIINVPPERIVSVMPELEGILYADRILPGIFDVSKIKSIIDYECSVTLDQGLKRTVDFYEQNNNLEGIDYRFDALLDRCLSNMDIYKEDLQKLHFIDYLGNATKKDYVKYCLFRYMPFRIARKIEIVLSRIKKRK